MYITRFDFIKEINRKNGDKTNCEYEIKGSIDGQEYIIGYDEDIEEICIISENDFAILLHYTEYFAGDDETIKRTESRKVNRNADKKKIIDFINNNYEIIK